MQSTDRTKLYYVGIIDILTHWTAKKKIEHVARVLQYVVLPFCPVLLVFEILYFTIGYLSKNFVAVD